MFQNQTKTTSSFFGWNEKDHSSFKWTKIPTDLSIFKSWVSKMNNKKFQSYFYRFWWDKDVTFVALGKKVWNNG
jgi:hypothetical protein